MMRLLLKTGLLLALALVWMPDGGGMALARESDANSELPNPLELTEPDPLLPEMVVDRPLSPQEQTVLRAALDELQARALARLQAGDLPGAFDLWNRELRLRRYLGVEEEVAALSRVGVVAWRESQVTEVRLITQRLQQIQQTVESQSPNNYDLLLQIAQAYQNMRAKEPAVGLYNDLLAQAQQQRDVARQQQILTTLGRLHLAWFDYGSAAITYETLVKLAREQDDRPTEIQSLQRLAEIYEQNAQLEKAIATQQKLLEIHEQQQEFALIPALKLSIGDDYLILERPDLAATNYQEAFAVSRSVQHYGLAGESLQRLAMLYRSLDRLEDVLVVYQLLLDVQQQTYDSLGMMNTYDQIGQIHRTQGNAPEAQAAFQQGLQIAQQLNYRQAYFRRQLEQAGQ